VVQAWIDDMNSKGWPGFDRLKFNFPFWQGVFGLSTTGVFSPADLAANSAGMAFYKAVYADPNATFRVTDYLTDRWNEEKNPSCYGSATLRGMAAHDEELSKEFIAAAHKAVEGNRMVSSEAGAAMYDGLLAKYMDKYQCKP